MKTSIYVGGAAAALMAAFHAAPARAEPVVSCGGAVMLGAAQLMCNHVQPKEPAQICSFSWALLASTGKQRVVEGTFAIPPAAINVQAYSAGGFSRALSNPIVLCRKQ